MCSEIKLTKMVSGIEDPQEALLQSLERTIDAKRKAIGQYYDDVTSLNYYNARYMSGVRGQFMSQDPLVKKIGLEIKGIEQLLLDPQMQIATPSYASLIAGLTQLRNSLSTYVQGQSQPVQQKDNTKK